MKLTGSLQGLTADKGRGYKMSIITGRKLNYFFEKLKEVFAEKRATDALFVSAMSQIWDLRIQICLIKDTANVDINVEEVAVRQTDGALWTKYSDGTVVQRVSSAEGAKCAYVSTEQYVMYKVVTGISEDRSGEVFAVLKAKGAGSMNSYIAIEEPIMSSEEGMQVFTCGSNSAGDFLLINCCDPGARIRVFKVKS